jgi:hypothetical protein
VVTVVINVERKNMSGYTPLFSSLVSSTIWQEDLETKVLWVTMLALKNQHGVVEGSIPGLAHIAGIPIEKCRKSIQRLESPDPDSRTQDFEGKRIKQTEDGWLILNHEKYSQKARNRAEYFKEYRKSKSKITTPTNTPVTVTPTVPITETKKEKKKEEYSAQFLSFWDKYPRKEGKAKAMEAFLKIKPSPELLEVILKSVNSQRPRWTEPKYIPHPATWLNGHRWEDEPLKIKKWYEQGVENVNEVTI